nr:DUF1127 domain-containing protein [uncultured Enterobacter sp.]
MEFFENRPKQPFIGFVMIWRAFKKWRLQIKARRTLGNLSDAQLRDVGLSRDDVC